MSTMTPEGLAASDADMFALREGSGWPEGDAIVEQVFAAAGLPELMVMLERLERETETMPIAGRFSTTHPLWDARPESVIDPCLPEAEHKRQQLLADIRRMRGLFTSAYARLGSVILDKEVTSREI